MTASALPRSTTSSRARRSRSTRTSRAPPSRSRSSSHEDASLAEGWIEAGEVECPLHATRFCLRTGEPMCLPATRPVAAHKVEVRDGDVYLFPGVTPAS